MLNRITVMGRLVRDPELRHTQSGIPMCSITIACDRDYKDADGSKSTDFIDIVAWRNTAEFISKYLSKRAYKENGAPRSSPDAPASVPFCWSITASPACAILPQMNLSQCNVVVW